MWTYTFGSKLKQKPLWRTEDMLFKKASLGIAVFHRLNWTEFTVRTTTPESQPMLLIVISEILSTTLMRTEIILTQQPATGMTTFWLQNCRFTCICAFISWKIKLELNNQFLKSSKAFAQTLHIRHITQQPDRHHQLEAFLFRRAYTSCLGQKIIISFSFSNPKKKPKGKKTSQNQTTQNPTKQTNPNENKHHPSLQNTDFSPGHIARHFHNMIHSQTRFRAEKTK